MVAGAKSLSGRRNAQTLFGYGILEAYGALHSLQERSGQQDSSTCGWNPVNNRGRKQFRSFDLIVDPVSRFYFILKRER